MRLGEVRQEPEEGFSLMELIVVLVILGLLAGVVGIRVFHKYNDAKLELAKIQIREFGGTLEAFAIEIGRYPTTEEGLEALIRNPDGIDRHGPYLKKTELPSDPWGRPYVYRCPGEHDDYDLLSYGPDGVEGGEGTNADIVSWK